MLEAVLEILRCEWPIIIKTIKTICGMMTMSAVFLVLFRNTKPIKRFWKWMEGRRILAIIILIMYVIGLIDEFVGL